VRNDKRRPHNDPVALALDGIGNLSRRDFIRLNLALLVMAGTSSCSWPYAPRDKRSEFRILRVDDLLALHFELHNLRIEHRLRKPARLVRIRDGEDALLLVGFPGQHILEQAYPERAGADPIVLPAKSRIARPSRLVFKIPPDRGAIDLTFDALLDWREWIPLLPDAGPGGRIVAPAADRSIVELPYGLALSPQSAARWAHATQPVTHDGRTELWHTRLTSGDPRQPSPVTVLRLNNPVGDMAGVETSLTQKDREQLAGRTAEAMTLILSPMGGWLDVRGSWEPDSSIARWQHNVTAGQDQRVVIQRKEGFLYPFGQRASLISVTERKLWHARKGHRPYALLRKRNFIVIKKPVMEYRHGEMALSRMTVLDLVTPPLYISGPQTGPFWIETEANKPFLFRFRAHDWAERRLWLEAPAIFVTEEGGDAQPLYESSDISRRTSPLRGQSAVVAKFGPVDDDKDRWGEPLSKQRSEGDTTLYMLHIEFAGQSETHTPKESPPFSCRTARMEVRVPSLEQYLNDEQNRGWFELVDPDARDNLGEIFARAQGPDDARIPMYFDEQADRCGGVAAPSFDVDGLSRVRGPVGDARKGGPMYRDGKLNPETYFNGEHANLLGGFPLAGLLLVDDGTKSPAVPTIKFIMTRKQPGEKAAKKGAEPYWEVGLGLGWSIALQKLKAGFATFAPEIDKKGKPTTRLLIDASVTKTLGKSENSDSKDGRDQTENRAKDRGADTGNGKEEKPKTPSVKWSVSGKITRFALELDTALGWISIGFEHFGVKLGPPEPKKKNEKDEPEDGKEGKQEKDDKKDKEKKLTAEIDYKMSEIKAKGWLYFLIKLIQIAADLPRIPDLSTGEASSVYPAKLPGAGDADINVTVGPIEAPKFKWLKFDVSNVSASVGVGLYFLPRKLKASEPPRVPDNLFTIRIASAEKPLTLMAEPWGGLAHADFNFTTKGMTGFQGSLGIVYRAEFDLSAAKAKCEGSLAGVFTYAAKADSEDLVQFDLVLKLSGQATIAGFIDINLALVAVGSRQAHSWFFFAEISVRVQIFFFAVSARFRFNYELADESGGGDRLRSGAATAPETARMAKSEWLAYRSAFAQEA
jgi:hypothetical protein